MSRLRIGLVIGQLHRGGAEKQLTALVLGLKRDHGIEPVVYCLSPVTEPYGTVLRRHGVTLRAFSMTGTHKLTRSFSLARAMAADLVGVVQAFLVGPILHTALANIVRRRPFVAACRIVDQPSRFSWIESWAHNRADVVTVNAQAGMEYVRQSYRIPDAKLRLIPNGIDANATPLLERSAARRRLGIADDAPVMLGVGRLVPQKRFPLFLDVAEEVLAGAADGVCLIAGDGPERSRLEQRVKAAVRSDQFRILGATDDIPLLLAASDLLLLTSGYEGTPNAVMEAMSASLPVVATRVGGVPDLVREGKTGYLLDSGDRAGLVEACRRLLWDRAAATAMGEQGRTRMVSEFSMERMVTRYAELYETLAARHGAGRRVRVHGS